MFPVPQIKDETAEVIQRVPHEHSQARVAKQIVAKHESRNVVWSQCRR